MNWRLWGKRADKHAAARRCIERLREEREADWDTLVQAVRKIPGWEHYAPQSPEWTIGTVCELLDVQRAEINGLRQIIDNYARGTEEVLNNLERTMAGAKAEPDEPIESLSEEAKARRIPGVDAAVKHECSVCGADPDEPCVYGLDHPLAGQDLWPPHFSRLASAGMPKPGQTIVLDGPVEMLDHAPEPREPSRAHVEEVGPTPAAEPREPVIPERPVMPSCPEACQHDNHAPGCVYREAPVRTCMATNNRAEGCVLPRGHDGGHQNAEGRWSGQTRCGEMGPHGTTPCMEVEGHKGSHHGAFSSSWDRGKIEVWNCQCGAVTRHRVDGMRHHVAFVTDRCAVCNRDREDCQTGPTYDMEGP